ncbi:hypothetical protein ACO229_22815 [Promicromonospora sp. MS192]|uniref:hypothetical protein n=1 Tax=Promicromonospora sp. MS192 TaxID=3412684 RepID=UPI003C308B38
MELIASDEALQLVDEIARTLPTSQVGLTGDAQDGPIAPSAFTSLYPTLLAVAACDTSPNPRENCPDVRDYVRSGSGLNYTDPLREKLGSGPESSTATPRDLTDLYRRLIGGGPEASTAPE